MEDRFVLEDLSGNGTVVNGDRVRRTEIVVGDHFRVGDFEFELGADGYPVILQESEPAAASPASTTPAEARLAEVEELLQRVEGGSVTKSPERDAPGVSECEENDTVLDLDPALRDIDQREPRTIVESTDATPAVVDSASVQPRAELAATTHSDPTRTPEVELDAEPRAARNRGSLWARPELLIPLSFLAGVLFATVVFGAVLLALFYNGVFDPPHSRGGGQLSPAIRETGSLESERGRFELRQVPREPLGDFDGGISGHHPAQADDDIDAPILPGSGHAAIQERRPGEGSVGESPVGGGTVVVVDLSAIPTVNGGSSSTSDEDSLGTDEAEGSEGAEVTRLDPSHDSPEGSAVDPEFVGPPAPEGWRRRGSTSAEPPLESVERLLQRALEALSHYAVPAYSRDVIQQPLADLARSNSLAAAEALFSIHDQFVIFRDRVAKRLMSTQKDLQKYQRDQSKGPQAQVKLDLAARLLRILEGHSATLADIELLLLGSIAELQHPETATLLAERLDPRSELALARSIVAALRKTGSIEVVPSLIAHVGVRDAELRREVVFTLETLTGVSLGEKPSEWRAWWKERQRERSSS